jgi:cobalt transporter subunit CbtA
MITRTVLLGLAAGTAAGVVLTALYLALIQPMILEAEVFELGTAEAAAGMTFGRILETLLFNVLTGVGFAMLLAALLTLRGRPVGLRQGLLWGAAGFAVATLAPAVGLPPELPGMAAAPLVERQIWWLLTVLATAAGLGLLVFAPNHAVKLAGVTLLIVPHLFGAPHPAGNETGGVPAELAARFAAVSLVSMALFWAVLGGTCGYLSSRLTREGAGKPGG